MSRTKLIRVLCGLLLAGVLIIEGLAFVLVYQLKMLPNAYLVLLAAFLLLLWIGLGALLFLPGKKRKLPGAGRTVTIVILVAVIIFGSGVACKVASDVRETMEQISTPTKPTAYVEVYVRADDPAQSVADAADYIFAITEYYDIENTRKAIALIENDLGSTITTVVYPSVYAMADALLAGQADAMLINTAYIALMTEAEGYTDFSARARLLEQFDIAVTIKQPENNDQKDPAGQTLPSGSQDDPVGTDPSADTQPTEPDVSVKVPDGDITKVPFVVYLGGADSRVHGLAISSANDVNILAVVNPVTKQVLLINTPRDYYIPNPAGNGAMDKLNACGVPTVENSVLALSQFYEVPIRFYGHVGFDGIQELVDAVDGVTVYSGVSYMAMDQTWIQKGDNHLNGEQALNFARDRKNLEGGDNDRGNNQMKIIKALIKKLASGKIISKYTDILRSLQGMFRTNMTAEEMASLVQMQLSDLASWNVVTYAVTGEGTRRLTYTDRDLGELFVYIPNMDTVEYARELMQRVVDGEILDQASIG